MRIVHVAPDFYPIPPQNYGGIERMIFCLIEESVKRGHEVFLYAREGSQTSAHLIPYFHEPGNPERIAEYVLETLPEDIDLIHDHTHHSIMGRKKLSVPTVCTIHDSLNNEIENPVYVSKRALEVVGKNRGYYVHNGIEIKDYKLESAKEDYLLFLGVISWHKGIHHALQIAETTNQRMIIAGPVFNDDFYQKEVEPRIKKLPNVEYVGEVGGARRLELFQRAKCLVFPTSWEEPFGLVMVEAMACGTPIMALANGAVPEVLQGYPSFICHTTEQMVEGISNLSCNPSDLRKYVADHFSVEKMADNYFSVYEQVLSKNQENMNISKDWHERAEQLKEKNLFEQAFCIYEEILNAEDASKEDKVAACNEAADLFYRQGDYDQERFYAFKSFQYDQPRAEICCRLGYQFLQQEKVEQAIFWYTMATQLEKPDEKAKLYYDACWTWLPLIQLCICHYKLGNYEQAYHYNEEARRFEPNNEFIIKNKQLLAEVLMEKEKPVSQVQEVNLLDADGKPFRMFLQTPGFIEEMIIKEGKWEPHLALILRPFIKKGSVFLDIGANIGYHSLHLANLCPDAKCISFEPHPTIFQQLFSNIEVNNHTNIVAYPFAVGDEVGKTRFYMQDSYSYNRGMSAVEFYDGLGTEYTEVDVSMTSLDHFLNEEESEKVSVIKIDTQGNEYQVIKGALSLINQSKPIIAIELHNNAKESIYDILTLLNEYKVFKVNLWDGRITEVNEDNDPYHHDYIYVPIHLVENFLGEKAS